MPEETKAPLLVVDDEEPNRDLLARRLNRAGYEVAVAASGEEALGYIQREAPELVLLDMMMPGMSGLDLLKLLRATYSPSELPVIMVSAIAESPKVVDALRMGANDYVTKPVDFPVTLARVQSQLNRKRAEEALRESEERYALAARGANDGLWDWDLARDNVYYSPRWKEMLGYEELEISNSPGEWLSRVHPEDRVRVKEALAAHRSKVDQAELELEHRLLHKDGSFRWMLCRGVVLHDGMGAATRMAGSLTDVTENKTFDSLTGLPNRTLFTERLVRAMEEYAEEDAPGYAVLFIDLDRFKVVNDSLGHMVGDQLLVGVSKRLNNAVRSGGAHRGHDVAARFGGDEFAVLLEELDNPEQALAIAQRIQDAIRQPFHLEGREVFSAASIGIACANADYRDPAEVLRDADIAMYRAKAAGRGRCEVFDAEMRARALATLELENDLRKALETGQFRLHYQPKVRLISGQLAGFEALLRWNHHERGTVPPNDFIPLAEETGLIVPIGNWVLREAARTMRRWQRQYPVEPPLEMSVNVSIKQLQQDDFVGQVAEVLAETGIPPETLQLEITESVLVVDPEAIRTSLEQVKALGVGLKIDDFGTGYSSLNYLSQFPFDTLKIDRSFVLPIPEDRRSTEVIDSILTLAKTLEMDVVAEGIETKAQLLELRSLGCRFGQGFYFAKPLPEDEARRQIQTLVEQRFPNPPEAA